MSREDRRLLNIKQNSINDINYYPSGKSVPEGDILISHPRGKPLRLYKKLKGMLWWIDFTRDGNQYVDKDLKVKNVLNIRGHREEKNQPSFLAFNSAADVNWSTGAYADVSFDSEVFDVGDNFASDTFTAPITGRYFLHTSVGISTIDTAATYYALKLVTSNRNYHSVLDPNLASDTAAGVPSHLFQITCVADMGASDTAKVQLLQSGGTAQTDVAGAATELYTWFTGYLLG